jgi:PAS domain S-box-containing protein
MTKPAAAKRASAGTLSNARRAKPGANVIGRLRFESFLLELSAYFAKAPADFVDRGIDAWLEKLAGFIGVDRVSLWECDPDGVQMHRQHFYSRPGINIPSPIVRTDDFPWTNEQYQQGKIIIWERVPADVPAAAAAELTHSMRVGAKSVLGIPLRTGAAVYVLSCASVRAYRKWPMGLVRRMQLVGEILASALIRQRTERSLLASESRHRALLKALPDLIFVLNSEGVYIECHCPETVDLYVPPEQFIGRTMEEVIPGDLAKTFRALFQRACETGEVVEHEYVMPIAGEERQFETRMVRRDDGAIVAIVRNISERHRAATERRQSLIDIGRARLELAHIGRVALVGQLTSSLAHELLQPITAVVNNAEAGLLAPDLDATSEMHAVLQDIADSGRRAGDIIQHVRALLRKERAPYVTVDLNRLVQEVAHVMRSDLMLHQVHLTTELDSSNAEINGDRGELQQVLLNLVLNGIEAMHSVPIPERQLRISTIVRSDAVELNVQDKGCGSPPGHMERLLEPFFTTKANGVGMGLSICADIVRAHRGQLIAENNADQGMTWRCILPHSETAPKTS